MKKKELLNYIQQLELRIKWLEDELWAHKQSHLIFYTPAVPTAPTTAPSPWEAPYYVTCTTEKHTYSKSLEVE